jgi:hypothetical protein
MAFLIRRINNLKSVKYCDDLYTGHSRKESLPMTNQPHSIFNSCIGLAEADMEQGCVIEPVLTFS